MKIILGMSVLMVVGVAMAGQEVRVTADRVNVRAKPLEGAEVVGQVNQGDSLSVVSVEDVWAEVRAPTNMAVWVKGEFVGKGVIVADKVNVRSGPGVSYRSVGSLRGGTAVQVREVRGEWASLVPPEGIRLWIKKEFLELGGEASATGDVAMVTGGAGVVEAQVVGVVTNTALVRELPEGLKEGQLAAVLGQGAVLERQGLLERVPMAVFRGVEYRLVDEGEGHRTTTCYLRGKAEDIVALMGKRVKVMGRGWWLNGERVPLIYVDAMTAE